MRTIKIGKEDPVTLSVDKYPTETPIGVLDRAVARLEFSAGTFHKLEDPHLWLNLETGEIVRIKEF